MEDAVVQKPSEEETEPLMIRYVSTVTGKVYDEETVDHMADIILILYAGGGTAIGAVLGACLGSLFALHYLALRHIFITIPAFGFAGALLGALAVLWLLHTRELIKWDGFEVQKIHRVKT